MLHSPVGLVRKYTWNPKSTISTGYILQITLYDTSNFPIQIHTFRTSSIQLSHEKYPVVTSHYTGWRNHSLYYRSFLQVGSNPLQGQMFPDYSLVSPHELHIFSTSLVTSMLANSTAFVYNETQILSMWRRKTITYITELYLHIFDKDNSIYDSTVPREIPWKSHQPSFRQLYPDIFAG